MNEQNKNEIQINFKKDENSNNNNKNFIQQNLSKFSVYIYI